MFCSIRNIVIIIIVVLVVTRVQWRTATTLPLNVHFRYFFLTTSGIGFVSNCLWSCPPFWGHCTHLRKRIRWTRLLQQLRRKLLDKIRQPRPDQQRNRNRKPDFFGVLDILPIGKAKERWQPRGRLMLPQLLLLRPPMNRAWNRHGFPDLKIYWNYISLTQGRRQFINAGEAVPTRNIINEAPQVFRCIAMSFEHVFQ